MAEQHHEEILDSLDIFAVEGIFGIYDNDILCVGVQRVIIRDL